MTVGRTVRQGRTLQCCQNRADADQLIAAMVAAMVDATSLAPPAQLWSVTQYKKVRLRYFTPDIDAWEAAYL